MRAGALLVELQKPVKPDVSYADLAGAKAGLRTTAYPLEPSDREEVVALTEALQGRSRA